MVKHAIKTIKKEFSLILKTIIRKIERKFFLVEKRHYQKHREILQNYRYNFKRKVLAHYCQNGDIKCACCGEKELAFLTIDHINNDGAKHRKILRAKGRHIYYWLKENNFPAGFQVLCYNCNCAKGHSTSKSKNCTNYKNKVKRLAEIRSGFILGD